MNKKVEQARSLITVASILVIVFGALWCFTLIGILWGVPMIIGGALSLGKRKLSDEDLVNSRMFFLGWGIFYILSTLIGGILYLAVFFTLGNIVIEPDNLNSVEKAYRMKEEGILSEEEFEEIKRRSI